MKPNSERKNNYVDFFRAFGRQDYVIYNKDYHDKIKNNPIVEGLWGVGRWFAYVTNAKTWKLEYVSGDSLDVTGYTKKEILDKNLYFTSDFILSEDYQFVNKTIQMAMNYVNELPLDLRLHVYVIYYSRCIRKDGKPIIVQNQSIPIVFDERNIPFVFVNIITDISNINPTNIPQSIIINKKTEEKYFINPTNPNLKPAGKIFTSRELEVIRLLIKGYSSRKVAKTLAISYQTARTHRQNILQKAGVNNTSQLISYVLLNKVV